MKGGPSIHAPSHERERKCVNWKEIADPLTKWTSVWLMDVGPTYWGHVEKE